MAKKIGELVFETRNRLGLTQAELGELLGIQQNSLARWERGEREPDGRYVQLALNWIEHRGVEQMREDIAKESAAAKRKSKKK